MKIVENNEDDEKEKINILEKSKKNENSINNYEKPINQFMLTQLQCSQIEKFQNDHKNEENDNENCNACGFCEDVCLLEFCKNCEIKRKELYIKYKKYDLKIHQSKLNRSIILSALTHKNILTNEYTKMKEIRDLSKANENEPKYKSTEKAENENEKNEEKKKKKYYSYIKYKKNFTFCEIKRHCSIDDCWVVANGNVYDVTNFIENHPGGINCILNKASNDVSIDFSFHSKYAQTVVWEPLKIGRVISCSKDLVDKKRTSNCIFM
ncbi:conserved Plasmodium protein, unknown function [Plasmodium berghei]|uniref:Heme/steroid binding domain containing protein, putative n=3 Tax=Plasmodium berghei TaxID=5821 RepID=A0A509AKT9_PLABA|nr:heme/steroid binding domain containing protein, putative [Plasmodium berghei ANKA]CXI51674.1 conserved Plasmodium protein, unknown function [Plasmodium berghei]SCL94469.1 conserved Plasmodium protein, unknown function [Plasmodium berghei]SCM17830.1 conserved Plasmodium protein, unknown function [Plasmodium berghei]SCN26103.1 conserved Plasmodium protein, unknown function [Plasmodium berghei]VUC56157.1 heme/steroid binding domain containing protein, putative [Plasmodium berghei ANKA]|eukprot:XP_034421959.1 heme/steroid binding domain containing protein, putative [Plasmodium berghei ANKA]